jgi:nicotinate-nucleotide adenylyltransferase
VGIVVIYSPGMSTPARRIGVLGGSFDPIHNVHLLIAREAARAFNLDEVVFVPVGVPSHKPARGMAAADDRCAMARLAVSSDARFTVSLVDVRRAGRTYTVDTLADLRRQYGPQARLFFLAGADALTTLPNWHRGTELWSLAHIIGSSRVGHRLSDPGLPHGRVSLLTIPQLDVSSTMIRERMRVRKDIAGLTPDAVADYIRRHGLYQESGMCASR